MRHVALLLFCYLFAYVQAPGNGHNENYDVPKKDIPYISPPFFRIRKAMTDQGNNFGAAFRNLDKEVALSTLQLLEDSAR